MRTSGLIFNSTFLVGASPAQTLNAGFEGAISFSAKSGFDPSVSVLQVCMPATSVHGSGMILVHSSKFIANNCTIPNVSFPAGEYIVRLAGGSSVVGALALTPTI